MFRVALVFLVLLVGLYFVVTSAPFVKKVVLPQVSRALQADITVADLQVSPLRKVVLQDVKIQPSGNEPLLTIKEVRARYSLFSILRGNIEVSELTVESPRLTIVQDADGRSNLDFLKSPQTAKPEDQSMATSTASSLPQLNLKLVALNNATVRLTKQHLSGAPDVVEVSGLNFKLQDLKNGESGKVELSFNASVEKTAQPAAMASALKARLGGQFTFNLAADLKPTEGKGGLSCAVENATGDWADLNALAARLDCDTTPTEIKQLAVRFSKAEMALGEVRVSGPFDVAKQEGKLKLEVLSLDRRVLNLVGAASGIDFGTTTVNASADLELLRGGGAVSVAGRVEAAQLQLVQQGRTSPTLDVRCDYAATIDKAAKTAEVRFLNLAGAQNARPFLQSELPRSLTLTWGGATTTASDATFLVRVSDLNLAEWREFLGDETLAGSISGTLQLVTGDGGKQLRAEWAGAVDKFAATIGSNRLAQADGRVTARVSVTDLKDLKLEDFRLELRQQGQAALVATASGGIQADKHFTDLQVSVQATLARLLGVVALPGLNVTNGTLALQAHLQLKDAKQSLAGKVTVADVSTQEGGLPIAHWAGDFEFDLAAGDKWLQIQKLAGVVRVGGKQGGRIDAGGKIEFAGATPSGRVQLKVSDVNQELVRPFLAPALGDKKLVSVTLGSVVTLDLDANDSIKLVADTQITNLVVSDPSRPALATPLHLRMQVDVGVAKQVAQIRQCRLSLTPTDRARNELDLAGTIDLAQPDAVTGNLKLSAAALDFTRYYDLLVSESSPAEEQVQPPDASSAPAREPEALVLPLQNFTCDIEIGHLYLREVDLSNWRATAKVSGGQITLEPCLFDLNGGPVALNVAADLGVPGYRYAVGLKAQAVPVPPLINTFTTGNGELIGGQFFGELQLQGAGVTGASLRTNLTGQFNLMTTNMNLAISNVRTPVLNLIVNTILGLPDLIGGLTGRWEAGQLRWADEITAQPIEVLRVVGGVGESKWEFRETLVKTAAFQVESIGAIGWGTAGSNTTVQFPLQVSLGRRYAEKLGMVYFNTPTNAAYIALPEFLTINGTMADVKSDFSQTGLLLLTGKSLGGVGLETGKAIGGVGLEAGKIVGDAGRLLYGTASGLFKPRLGNAGTNAVAGSATNNAVAPKKKSGIFNFFKRDKKE